MASRSWRILGAISVVLILAAACGDNKSNPVAPTPTPTPTPAPTPTPTPTPSEPAALDGVSVDPASVEGQSSATGTVTLTAAAPTGGAVIALQSGTTDAAKVPATVTVVAGAKTATFTVDTSTVPLPRQVTIQATYLGVTKLFVLTVRSPTLAPKFNVTSPSKGNDACSIVSSGGAIDCVFETSQSTGFIANYIWTLKVGSTETTFTTTSATYTPSTVCANLTGGTVNSGVISMAVSLVLEDRGGNKSGNNSTSSVALTVTGQCGY